MIRSKIEAAEMVLIGLGEELEESSLYSADPIFLGGKEYLEAQGMASLIPAWREYFVDAAGSQLAQALGALERCLEGKNYYVISTCIDSRIRNLGWKDDRIVMPCGDNRRLQCENGCEGEIRELTDAEAVTLQQLFDGLYRGRSEICDSALAGVLEWEKWADCGGRPVLNHIYQEKYNEKGYLDQWDRYLKWLRGTVNRKLLVLEIGVGMKWPSVIRWPFEKTVYFNQKAELIRVNGTLYQMTEELADRGMGIQKNAIEWLKEL